MGPKAELRCERRVKAETTTVSVLRLFAIGNPVERKEVDGNVQRQNGGSECHTDNPLVDREPDAAPGKPTPLHDNDLKNEGDDENDKEVVVVEEAREDVDFVVDLAAVDFVEELEEYKNIEDDSEVLSRQELVVAGIQFLNRGVAVSARLHVARATALDIKHGVALPHQHAENDELVQGMENHVAEHGLGEQRAVATVGLAVQQRVGGALRGERKGSKRVHDEVHPQELDRLEWRVTEHTGAEEGNHDCNQVDGELELQELADVVIHAAAPLDSHHD
mmetsp:Transcript_8943/g.20555  ORF Transcript_8943/g.20555 Transcript_8943/m.20555 type:complete len:277 (+) Transcript_8943:730-1560(+)